MVVFVDVIAVVSDDVELPTAQIVPLGPIVNELVTNARTEYVERICASKGVQTERKAALLTFVTSTGLDGCKSWRAVHSSGCNIDSLVKPRTLKQRAQAFVRWLKRRQAK